MFPTSNPAGATGAVDTTIRQTTRSTTAYSLVKSMLRILFLLISILVGDIRNLAAVILTHYGYEKPGDPNYDSKSAQGIGAFGFDTAPGSLNNIGAGRAVGVSPDLVQQYNLQPGQSFNVQLAGGQMLSFVFADKTADYLTGRIDVFDPDGTFNLDGAQVVQIAGGPVLVQADLGSANAAIQTINIAVVDQLLGKFKSAGQAWVGPLTKGATTLFWLLAIISLVWTGAIMVLKRAELSEILVELVRYIMTIGIFFWLLTNGPAFAGAIIESLRRLGGEASGTGQSMFPGELITIGTQVVQNQLRPISWLFPVAAAIPAILAIIVLIVCVLICANMVLLLIAGWIVAYAGVVVLGFGASKWTSDIAINYFRTALGIGLSLMTMQLVISIGIGMLKALVQATGSSGDIGQLIAITVTVILLAVIAHKLPQMVSGMVTGSGHNGGIGALGLMSAIGAAFAASSMARSLAAWAAGGAAAATGMSAADKLRDRMSVLETANAAGSGNGNGAAAASYGSSRMASTLPSSNPPAAPQASPGGARTASAHPSPPSSASATPMAVAEEEPPLDRPMSPDEQRGFQPPPDWQYPDEPV
jgi:type IV secretion system protein TrbL